MTAPIGPGDWVECVDVYSEDKDLRVGGIYCIEAMGEGSCIECGPALWVDLVGIEKFEDAAPCTCQFRPIYRPKAEFIESLKAPAPAKPVRVGEDA